MAIKNPNSLVKGGLDISVGKRRKKDKPVPPQVIANEPQDVPVPLIKIPENNPEHLSSPIPFHHPLPPKPVLHNSFEEARLACAIIYLKPGEAHTEFYKTDGRYHCVIAIGNGKPDKPHLYLTDSVYETSTGEYIPLDERLHLMEEKIIYYEKAFMLLESKMEDFVREVREYLAEIQEIMDNIIPRIERLEKYAGKYEIKKYSRGDSIVYGLFNTLKDTGPEGDEIVINSSTGVAIVEWIDIDRDADAPIMLPYIEFAAEENNSTISLKHISEHLLLLYSYDKIFWKTLDTDTIIELPNFGDMVFIRGILSGDNNVGFNEDEDEDYTQFKMTGKISVYGNCNALWNYEDLEAPLRKACGYLLFCDCDSLINSPLLPSLELSDFCYTGMFYGCTSLKEAPELPATELTQYCYNGMFIYCTSLEKAPELPALQLSYGCYEGMFMVCTSLEKAPELPALTLINECYAYMFNNCLSLNYIKCNAISGINQNDSTEQWVENVAEYGTFEKVHTAMWNRGENGIPENWEIIGEVNYLTYEARENNSKFGMVHLNEYDDTYIPEIYYSLNNEEWKQLPVTIVTDDMDPEEILENCIKMNEGDSVALYGNNPDGINNFPFISASHSYVNNTFIGIKTIDEEYGPIAAEFNMSGDITTLIEPVGNVLNIKGCNPGALAIHHEYPFINIFDASELILPSEKLCIAAYVGLFANTSLTYAPQILPATTLNILCYLNMFADCHNLITAPVLPATTLAIACYMEMFKGCTSLTTAPELPANELKEVCYLEMFHSCTNLVNVPELPATILVDECYEDMFYGCTSLTVAPELPATILAYRCYSSMFYGCTSLTVAPELPATILAESCYTLMFSNCTSLTTAPELPAITLAYNCYNFMFLNCILLNYIKCLAIYNINRYTSGWVYNVAPNGTFIASLGTNWSIGDSGVPTNWSINYYIEDADFLTYIAKENAKFGMIYNDDTENPKGEKATIYYSISTDNGEIWSEWSKLPIYNSIEELKENPISLLTNDRIRVCGNNSSGLSMIDLETGDVYFNAFIGLKTSVEDEAALFDVYGDITTLLNPKGNILDISECNPCPFAIWLEGSMLFEDASELILPSTKLCETAYYMMFAGQTSLTAAPTLPAAKLSKYCYYAMFNGCTSLEEAPELQAHILTLGCYAMMFNGCTSLNYIKCSATSGINENYSTFNWVKGVAPDGTFVKATDVIWPEGINGIPEEWVAQDENNYLTYEALDDAEFGMIYKDFGNNAGSYANIYYSIYTDEYAGWSKWHQLPVYTSIEEVRQNPILLEANNKIRLYGNNPLGVSGLNIETEALYVNEFVGLKTSIENEVARFNISGDITTLLNRDGSILDISEYNLCPLCIHAESLISIVNASNLVLPSTKLCKYAYYMMFVDQTELISTPELPATELTEFCYYSMFSGCTSLTTAPELPTSKLAIGCYSAMFENCTSLTTSPELQASTMVEVAYNYMFKGCTSLNYIICLAINNIVGNTYNWVYNVAEHGTFVKNTRVEWQTGVNGIPEGWIIENHEIDYLQVNAIKHETGEPEYNVKTLNNVEYGTTFGELHLPTSGEWAEYPDRTFECWTLDGEPVRNDYPIIEDVTTFTARFTINIYNVTAIKHETTVEVVETRNVQHGTRFSELDLPTSGEWAEYDDRTFKYWTLDGEHQVPDDYEITGNTIFTAKFEMNTYTVTFIKHETGEQEQVVETLYNIVHGTRFDELGLPAPGEWSTYQYKKFDCWTLDGEQQVPDNYEITGDITFTAKFKDITYKYYPLLNLPSDGTNILNDGLETAKDRLNYMVEWIDELIDNTDIGFGYTNAYLYSTNLNVRDKTTGRTSANPIRRVYKTVNVKSSLVPTHQAALVAQINRDCIVLCAKQVTGYNNTLISPGEQYNGGERICYEIKRYKGGEDHGYKTLKSMSDENVSISHDLYNESGPTFKDFMKSDIESQLTTNIIYLYSGDIVALHTQPAGVPVQTEALIVGVFIENP